MLDLTQTHINPIRNIKGDEEADFEQLVSDINVLSHLSSFRSKISSITGEDHRISNMCEVDLINPEHQEAIKELVETNNKIYLNLLNNLEFVLEEEGSQSVLIQIPSTHAKDFIPHIIERKLDQNSLFSKIKVEYYIFDSESAVQIGKNPQVMEQAYSDLLEKIYSVDKYVEIKDTTLKYASFADGSRAKDEIGQLETDFLDEMKTLGKKQTPRLKTYLPSKQQADDAGQDILSFSKIWEIGTRLNIRRIKEANEQLIELLDKTKSITIKGTNSDIEIDIEDQFVMNSWGRTNMPGAEVFTSPKLHGVNGTITFEEENVIKMFSGDSDNRIVKGISITFKDGKVTSLDIVGDYHSVEEKQKIIDGLNHEFDKITVVSESRKKLNENCQNRYTGEIAFGTTPHIVPGSLTHPLFAEKAFGMHIALGNSYKYKGMFNGNDGASFHWDVIGSMKGNTVSLNLKNGESVVVMNDGEYNKDILPKLANYRKEVLEQITPELEKLKVL